MAQVDTTTNAGQLLAAASGGRRDLRRCTFDVSGGQGIECDVGAGLGEHLSNSLADRPAPVMKTTFPVTSNSAGIIVYSPLTWSRTGCDVWLQAQRSCFFTPP